MKLVCAPQSGSSLIRRLAAASRAWVNIGVDVMVWVDETSLSNTVKPKTRKSRSPPTTSLWVAAPGVYNLRHILLYHRQEVGLMQLEQQHNYFRLDSLCDMNSRISNDLLYCVSGLRCKYLPFQFFFNSHQTFSRKGRKSKTVNELTT